MGSNNSSFLKSADKQHFLSRYNIGQPLGSGSFGTIVEATDRFTFTTVAVKYIKKKNVEQVVMVDGKNLPAEAVLLNSLHHPNIIEFVDLYQFKTKWALVMERPLASMDVHEFISQYGPQNDQVGAYMGRQLLDTCQYLHQHDIFHRDVKSENILVNYYTYHLKLIDFGTATRVEEGVIYNGKDGTPAFSPPEWITQSGYKPQPTTVWSCGVVLYEILTGSLPFSSYSNIRRGSTSFPDFVSRSARDLMRGMFRVDDTDRFTLQDALDHPFLCNEEMPEENDRPLDTSTYSRCSAYLVFENTSQALDA